MKPASSSSASGPKPWGTPSATEADSPLYISQPLGVLDVIEGLPDAAFGVRAAHSVVKTGPVQVANAGEVAPDQIFNFG